MQQKENQQRLGRFLGDDSRLVYRFCLLALAGAVLAFVVREDVRFLFNADVCYLPEMMRDVVSGGGLITEWNMPPSPYWFPDMLFYLVPYALTANPALSLFLAGLIQVMIFLYGWLLLVKRVARSPDDGVVCRALVVGVAILLFTIPSLRGVVFMMWPITVHFGSIVVTPYILLLLTNVASGAASVWVVVSNGIVMFLLVACSVFSDMSVVSQVVMPAVLSLMVVMLARRRLEIFSCTMAGVIAGGVVAAVLLLRLLDRSAAYAYIQPLLSLEYAGICVRYMVDALAASVKSMPVAVVVVAGSLALSAFIFVRVCYCVVRRRCSVLDVGAVTAAFVVTAAVLCPVSVLVVGRWSVTYIMPLIFTSVFAVPVIVAGVGLGEVSRLLLRPALAGGACLALALNCGYISRAEEVVRYSTHGVTWIDWVDAVAERYGLRCGMAGYWQAKPLALFSQRGLTVVQAAPDLRPNDWICNREWSQRHIPDFVFCTQSNCVTDMSTGWLPEKSVVARFGAPLQRFVFLDMALLLYSENDMRFKFWLKNHPLHVNFRRAGEKAVFNVAELSVDGCDCVDEGGWPGGTVAFGFCRCMPAGSYRIATAYKALQGDGAAVGHRWEVRSVLRNRSGYLAGGEMPAGTNCASGTFVLDQLQMVEVKVNFSGKGKLTLNNIAIERTR